MKEQGARAGELILAGTVTYHSPPRYAAAHHEDVSPSAKTVTDLLVVPLGRAFHGHEGNVILLDEAAANDTTCQVHRPASTIKQQS